jgi:8-oxo-dGTP pyrophosphatase MutT (NUDIX family)
MIEIGSMIIEEGLNINLVQKYRTTIRGVMINSEHQIFLVYSNLFNDYTFPGGGIKGEENDISALKRELKEEIGAEEIRIIKPIGSIQEVKYSIRGTDDVFLQTSKYYLCEVLEFAKQDLQEREKCHGLEPKWISIEEAILKNEAVMYDDNHQKKGLKTVLKRENTILEYLKENMYAQI